MEDRRGGNCNRVMLGGVPLSTLIPSVSKDAINLITLLCSWDPCKRPTASEVLRHPFFQTCYYVPPSLRPKAATIRTPPAGNKGSLEQKSVKRYSGGMLTTLKPPGALSSVKAHSNSNTGKQPARRTMPPPMRAGGLSGQSGLFLGRAQEIQSGRAYPRKVAR